MNRTLRRTEMIDWRTVGALRPVDVATGVPIPTPLELRVLEGRAELVRNLSGLYVVWFWSALAAHAEAFFEPPGAPPLGSLSLRIAITDPSGSYLSREVTVTLPRDPAPANAAHADSLFRPVDVPMYPAARGATGANWSVLRVSVSEDGSGDALGGALVHVRRNGDVIARGMTDGRGEALVAAVGVPMLTFGENDDAVVVDEIDVVLQAVFDPGAGSRTARTALRAGSTPPSPVVDPDNLEAHADTLPHATQPTTIAAGRTTPITMTLDLP